MVPVKFFFMFPHQNANGHLLMDTMPNGSMSTVPNGLLGTAQKMPGLVWA